MIFLNFRFLLHDSPGLIEKMVIVSAPHPNMFWDTLPKTGLINYNWMCLAQVYIIFHIYLTSL